MRGKCVAGQNTDDNIAHAHAGQLSLHTHTQNVYHLLPFYVNYLYANGPTYYVIRTLLVSFLFIQEMCTISVTVHPRSLDCAAVSTPRIVLPYCIVVGFRRLMLPDALQPKVYCTNPGL